MTEDFLESSDSVRSASPLRHAQRVTFDAPVDLELGGRLARVSVVYETYGTLNADRDNAVLICHALSGDSHVARHDPRDEPGWWDIVVGPGKAIDTDKFFVICPNILGGCRGTTGPNSLNPATGKPYGRDFPTITMGDMVEVHRMLIDALGIERLLCVIGGSLGGHQVLSWAHKVPDRTRGVAPIATSPRLTCQALAFDVVGRNAILRDPNYRGGHYYDAGEAPNVGLAIARMIGHITYLSRESMKEKFDLHRLHPQDVSTEFEKKFSVGSYLGYKGEKFVELFDANSYNTITMAMDLYDLGGSPEELEAAVADSDCRWLVLSFSSDWLFPPDQSRELVDALIATNKAVTYCDIATDCGHDAFLLEPDLDHYGEMIHSFLDNLHGDSAPPWRENGPPAEHVPGPMSIYHGRRLDYDRIMDLIGPEDSVLDLGCGAGGLLVRLADRGSRRIVGVDLREASIRACLRNGLDVVQMDLNRGLSSFSDDQFDTVVLSQTLQGVRDVEIVLDDMLRVGRRCIVSFPNFGYHKLRAHLAEGGRAPRSEGQLRYEWYDTPNIRFFTILDFEEFCEDKGITVHRCVALDTENGREVVEDPNRNADMAIFTISR